MRRFATCALVLLAAAACGPARAQGPRWADFTWGARDPNDPSSEQHAAILLPVTLAGAGCRMQLDTGVPASVLYRPMLPAKVASDGQSADVRLDVGGMSVARQIRLMSADDPAGRTQGCRESAYGPLAGSLGDDVFLDHALELDLRHARFRVFGAADARPPRAKGSHVLPFTLAQSAEGKVPVLSARLPDGRPAPLLFDTGAAGTNLLVFRKADWLALVGAEQAARATVTTASTWGHPLRCSNAPVRGPIRFDGLVLPAGLEASYCEIAEGAPFAGLPQLGALGLKPFQGQSLVIDFAAQTLHIREPD